MADVNSTDTFDLTSNALIVEAYTNYHSRFGVRPVYVKGQTDFPSSIVGFTLDSTTRLIYTYPGAGNSTDGTTVGVGSYNLFMLSIDGNDLKWSVDRGSGFSVERTKVLTDDELLQFKSVRISLQGGTSGGGLVVGSINILPAPQNTGAFLQFF